MKIDGYEETFAPSHPKWIKICQLQYVDGKWYKPTDGEVSLAAALKGCREQVEKELMPNDFKEAISKINR